jgi:outer membrane receptor for ferrienterochelin and colicins
MLTNHAGYELRARTALSSAVALAACFPFASSLAAEHDSASLDKLVVTAAGFEQKIVDAPASISVITQDDLMQKRYSNLAQALADVEGVDISQGTGKTGGLNISIRGMPSDYTLILIDGRRQNNGGSITPNGFGETSTSFMPPLSSIERIEVIRGPMSTLYGSDAMGGVINIITRKVASEWGGSVGIDHTVHENRGWGASTGTSIYAAGPLLENLIGLSVRGNVIDRAASKLEFGDGGAVSRRGAAAVDGRIFNAGARLSFTPSDRHYFYLDFERGRQVYNNDDCQLGTLDGRAGNAVGGCTATNSTAAGYSDQLRFHRDQVVLSHDAQLGFGSISNSLMYKLTETIGRTIPGTIGQPFGADFPGMVGGAPRELKSEDLVFDTRLLMPLGDSHRVSLGGQWADTKVRDGLAVEEFSKTWWALYAEDEWRLLESLALTVGARYEDHESFGGHVSPRAYLVWNATDNWTFKGGAAQGYRTPTVNELHDGINGVTGQGRTLTIGSPHLEPETSVNTEIGAYFDNRDGFDANVTLFQTRFKDLISTGTPIPNCHSEANPELPGCVSFGENFTQDSFAQSTNIDEAETRGAEAGFGWFFLPDWKLSANYTYTDTEQKSGVDKGAPLTTQAKHMANASLNWFATDRLTLWVRGEYRGARDRFTNLYDNLTPANRAIVDAAGKLKSFTQFHLGGSYRATENVTLTATIYNLFDKDFLTGQFYETGGDTLWASDYTQIGAGTTGTIQEGRRLWVSANISF